MQNSLLKSLASLPASTRQRILRSLTTEELALVYQGTQEDQYANEDLCDFVPRISPRFEAPRHLSLLSQALQRTELESVRCIVNVPPRHSKTETILHYIAQRLKKRPQDSIIYVTYGAALAHSKSRLARAYALAAGVELAADSGSLANWRTTSGGGCIFTSIGGAITGEGCVLLIIDDPHKDRAEAESFTIRNGVIEYLKGTAFTRVEPGGSVILCHTRWHPDDAAGTMLKDHADEWELIKIEALGPNGPLWPSRWSLEELLKRRKQVGEFEWASQFQGMPRPRGGSVFNNCSFYDELPAAHLMSWAIGADFAYSQKSASDYSVAVVMAKYQGEFYVVKVLRMQVAAPEFASHLKKLQADFHGAPIHAYIGGTEIGTVDFFAKVGVRVIALSASGRGDKFVRSIPTAAAWNGNLIKVPHSAFWLDPYVSEMASFTGISDSHDDQVDATTSAYDALNIVRVARSRRLPDGFSP